MNKYEKRIMNFLNGSSPRAIHKLEKSHGGIGFIFADNQVIGEHSDYDFIVTDGHAAFDKLIVSDAIEEIKLFFRGNITEFYTKKDNPFFIDHRIYEDEDAKYDVIIDNLPYKAVRTQRSNETREEYINTLILGQNIWPVSS